VSGAYIEFVLNDPWYIVQLKYFNALQVFDFVGRAILREWLGLDWRFLGIIMLTAAALVVQIRQKAERLEVLTSYTGILGLCAVLIALPVWAMVIQWDLLTDPTLFSIAISFVVALWMIVGATVVLGRQASRIAVGFFGQPQKGRLETLT
jgi:hypothetical protein